MIRLPSREAGAVRADSRRDRTRPQRCKDVVDRGLVKVGVPLGRDGRPVAEERANSCERYAVLQ